LKQVYPVSPAITGVFYGGPYISKTGVFDPAIAKAGLHTVIYKAIDVNLCENVDSIQLRVNGHPIADFTGVPLSGCVPLTVDFTATPGYTKYDWDFGNGKTGQGDILQSKYPNAGSYPISLKVTDINNCVSIVTKPNYITAHPRPQASFNYSPKQINLSLTTVQFTNFTVGSNISKYTWTVDNQFETNQQDFSKIFHDSGNIKISMIAENQWGCIDSTTQYIFVIDTFIIFIPNAFSPNNDGVNDIFKVGGIGIRYLEMNIYNRWGERLFTQKDDSNSFGWDGIYLDETVPQGAYMYTILARDNINRPYLFKGMVTVLK
jgi:gliding motility-associated-like protein